MRYLVTGGAGFIGSNIVERLVQRGERPGEHPPGERRRDAERAAGGAGRDGEAASVYPVLVLGYENDPGLQVDILS